MLRQCVAVARPLLAFMVLVGVGGAATGFAQGDPFANEPVQHVIVTQPNAAVHIDGRFVGAANAHGELDLMLRPGTYGLRIEKDGFHPVIEAAYVAPDLFAMVPRPLVPVEPEAPWGLFALLGVVVIASGGLILWQRRPPRFDRYRVYRPIGSGGMATVFLARDRARRRVALKVMDPALLQDADLVRKFLKEGEVLQMIASTSPEAPVVRAHSYGRENGSPAGRPFVALEFLAGDTLLKFFREREQLPVHHVLAIARQVCEGLAAAHLHGVWHRDVSPDNVLLTHRPSGAEPPTIRLIDFGVAKHEYTMAKTLDGSISGKPPYMSPEQCRGQALDGRSDLYSVGVMMYTLLTGRPPFTDANPLLVMRMHETAAVPPLPSTVPPAVRDLVMSLLAKNPADRPPSAPDVVLRLSLLERSN